VKRDYLERAGQAYEIDPSRYRRRRRSIHRPYEPLRYDDGGGGEELRHSVRCRVIELTDAGIAGTGIENDAAIVPSKHRDFDKIELTDKVEFLPWTAILRVGLLNTSADYERIWADYEANPDSLR
jgi:hypothetical protein